MTARPTRRPKPAPTARISALIARKARKAVVFRRGPSRSVLALTWNLADDTLTPGQWFKGRIYERRCDLSPDGELLVYFAGYRGEFRTWTAISRPPYFTALALWPKGDAWGGGGLFPDAHSLALNHRPPTDERARDGDETQLAPGFSLTAGFRVQPFGDWPGWGEDDPIHTTRQERDGWRVVSEGGGGGGGGDWTQYDVAAPLMVSFDPPLVWAKAIGATGATGATLRVTLSGLKELDGRWYVESSDVASSSGEILADLGRTDWSDVDHNGDVLYAQQGRLYRLPVRGRAAPELGEPVLVADLNDLRFQRVSPPDSARIWPKSARSAGFPGPKDG